MKTILNLLVAACFLIGAFAQAQTASRHPRAVELEAQLSKDAMAFLKGRFPDMPFMVVVNLDPMHRYGDTGKPKSGEQLPYLNLQDDEIADEWDDPAVPLVSLLNRVKKVVVNVSLPSSLKDDDLAEIEASMQSVLNLTPARDQIKFQRRNWIEPQKDQTITLSSLIALAIAGALVGFYFISQASSKRLAKALATQPAAAGASASPMPSSASTPEPTRSASAKHDGPSGDVSFNDTLKVREFVLHDIKRIAAAPAFPSLQDMVLLDKFGKEKPAALGAILVEFPLEVQKRIFSLSYGPHWLEALNEPGDINLYSFELVKKMERILRDDTDRQWQQLLTYVWRLDSEREFFFRSIKQDVAFAILSRLPKQMAVTLARSVFPGSWAVLLDNKFKAQPIADEEVEKLSGRCLQIKSLRDFSMLEVYKHDKDLLSYLKTADPVEERDIYGAAPSESLINSLRPAFFKVLDLSPEQVKPLITQVSLDDWALSAYNVSRDSRRNLETAMSDKQKFMYREKLKNFDMRIPTMEMVGEARERIARKWEAMKPSLNAVKPTPQTTETEETESAAA